MKFIYPIIVALFLVPNFAFASISIIEIMYDLDGADTDREWVEIFNDGGTTDLTGWKFNDGSNHILNIPPKNGGIGSMNVTTNSYVVLTEDANVFLSEHSNYSGTIIDTTMSLGNTDGVLSLIDTNNVTVDSVSYNKSMGANDDGNSLQKIGGSLVSAVPTPGAGAISNQTTNNTNSATSTPVETTVASSNVSNWPTEQQVFVNAGPDKIVIVGADVTFEGKALGIEKRPLENAHYVWNFGDGATKEGKIVTHAYKYPGEYVVVLDVASGYFSGTDKVKIQAEPSKIVITSIGDIEHPLVEISNNSNFEIDLSSWIIKSGTTTFYIPKNTFILANKKVSFSSDVLGFIPTTLKSVELFYPNGTLVHNEESIISSKNTSNNVVLSSNVQPTGRVIEESPTKEINLSNTASVNNAGDSKSTPLYMWIFGVLLVALIGGLGVVSMKNFGSKNNKNKSEIPNVREFKIIEEE